MPTFPARPYRDPADLPPMRRLLTLGAQSAWASSYMHPGWLDWTTHTPPDETLNRLNLRLWESADPAVQPLAAWAIYDRHEGSFDLVVHPALYGAPAHDRLMAEFVDWATARARAEGLTHLWPFWAGADDVVLDRLLRAHGYDVEAADPAPPIFGRGLADLPPAALPPGFTVQPVLTDADGRQRAGVTYGAFRSTDDWEDYAAQYARFRASAVYAPERDLLVRAPDGRGAAACTLWLDPETGVGLFEPVATHPDFHRRGLASAVMVEGLRRMRAAGMQRAVLGFSPHNQPARALYTALGFSAVSYCVVARRAV